MAGTLGELIMQLSGHPDPRQALYASMAQGMDATQQPTGTPAAPGTDPATGGPAPTPQPQAYQSPPDLAKLYTDLIQYDEAAQGFNRGIGLIMSGLSGRDENRTSIYNAFQGGGGGSDTLVGGNNGGGGLGGIGGIIKLQNDIMAMKQQAATRAALPAIAKKYGLDLETATYLFNSGQLDTVISEAEKEHNQIVQGPDGRSYLVDKTTGKVSEPLTPEKEREIELVDDPVTGQKIAVDKITKVPVKDRPLVGQPKKRETEYVEMGDGSKVLVYKDDKTPVGPGEAEGPLTSIKAPPKKITFVDDGRGGKRAVDEQGNHIAAKDIQGWGSTEKEQLYNAAKVDWLDHNPDKSAKDFPDLNTWITSLTEKGANKTTFTEADPMEKELAKTSSEGLQTDYETARASRGVLDDVANATAKLDAGIIAGSALSPLELGGRKVWADIMDLPDEATENTEAFRAALKETVLSKVKALGSGTAISDADRKFIEQAVGGDITLTEGGMRKIFSILKMGARKKISEYNKDVDDLISSYPTEEGKTKIRRLLRKVDLPDEKPVSDTGSKAVKDMTDEELQQELDRLENANGR